MCVCVYTVCGTRSPAFAAFQQSTVIKQLSAGDGPCSQRAALAALQRWLPVGPGGATPEAGTWERLFRASADGKTPSAFHRFCDRFHGGTVVLVHGTAEDGSMVACGAYTAIEWDAPRRGVRHVPEPDNDDGGPGSFLFCLQDGSATKPVRLPIAKRERAVVMDANFGPLFGAGPDLRIGAHSDLLGRLGSRAHTAAPVSSYDASEAARAGCVLFRMPAAGPGDAGDGEAGAGTAGDAADVAPVKFTAVEVEVFGVEAADGGDDA